MENGKKNSLLVHLNLLHIILLIARKSCSAQNALKALTTKDT